MHTMSSSSSSVQRKRKPDKAGKGLRHFSMKVCEKVQEKGKTTYNEVADDLVTEEMKNNSYDNNCDQKNIRRRVYDALNVLMAINVISKDKKEIRWIGLPANSAEVNHEIFHIKSRLTKVLLLRSFSNSRLWRRKTINGGSALSKRMKCCEKWSCNMWHLRPLWSVTSRPRVKV